MGVFKIILEELKAFGERTSIAGLSNAAHTPSKIRKLIWLGIFVALMTLTVQTFVYTVLDYLSYPILTTVNVTRMPNIHFPAISVCNVNRIHCTNLVKFQLEEAQRYAESPSEEGNATLESLNSLLNITGCRQQVCKSLTFMPPVRTGKLGDNVDIGILAFAELGCKSSFDQKTKHCYYLQLINEESLELNNSVLYDRSLSAYDALSCKVDDTCRYRPLYDVPKPILELFVLPKLCEEGQKFKSTKRKPSSSDGFYNTRPLIEEESKFFRYFFQLPTHIRVAIGHSFDSKVTDILGYKTNTRGFFVSCLYRGESCLNENISWVNINLPRYGNCYTFNSENRRHTKLRSTSLTGAANGVSMSFYIDQDNYIVSRLSENAGIRIVIHEPGKLPLPDEDGIDIHPGTSTSIAIQKSDILRLPAPYVSKCISNWSETLYANLTEDHPLYSIAVCQNFCLQLRLLENCNCVHPYIYELGGNPTRKTCDISPKNNSSDSDFKCFQQTMEEFNSNILTCKCNVACGEVIYSSQPTLSAWPSETFWEGLGAAFGLIPKEILPLPEDKKQTFQLKIQKDFSRTTIYFQTLSVKTTEQIPKYSEESFVSGLGGAMSLYLGIAIIMIFEILEFVFDIMSGIGAHFLGGRKRKGRISVDNKK